MRRNGNTNSNRRYNPSNTKPQVPLDVDEVDAALERYMRQKYDLQLFSGGARRAAVRHDTGETGSTRSSDDMPPPLPPKPGKRFGFGLRSVSSALPLGRNSHISPPTSPDTYGTNTPPLRVNKQSRVFGATVGGSQNDVMDSKLASLREMGFTDDKRNAHVLKGLNGNVERAVETLIRLGEGGGSAARNSIYMSTQRNFTQPAPKTSHEPVGLSRVLPKPPSEPDSPGKASLQATTGAQDANQRASANPFPDPNPSQSYNPFDALDSQAPNTAPLENGFANMQISQPTTQPLFPNATGGYPMQLPQIPDARLQHSMTPPIPQMPNPQPPQSNGYNPFLRNQQQPLFTTVDPFQTAQNGFVSTPPLLSPSTNPSSPLYQTQFASRQQSIDSISTAPSYYQQAQRPSITQFSPQSTNPFMAQQISQQNGHGGNTLQSTNPYVAQLIGSTPQPFQPQQQQQSQQMQVQPQTQYPQASVPIQHSQFLPQHQSEQSYVHPLLPQPTGSSRLAKSSILALYNNNDTQQQQSSIPQSQSYSNLQPADPLPLPLPDAAGAHQPSAKRSVTMPLTSFSGNRNPFQSAAPISQAPPPTSPTFDQGLGSGAGLAAAAGVGNNLPNGAIQDANGASNNHSNRIVTNGTIPSMPSPQFMSRPGLSNSQHMSRDSVLVSGTGSGRHSPDVWGSLSARFR